MDARGSNQWQQFWRPGGAPLSQCCSSTANFVSFKSRSRNLAKLAKIHGPIVGKTVNALVTVWSILSHVPFATGLLAVGT